MKYYVIGTRKYTNEKHTDFTDEWTAYQGFDYEEAKKALAEEQSNIHSYSTKQEKATHEVFGEVYDLPDDLNTSDEDEIINALCDCCCCDDFEQLKLKKPPERVALGVLKIEKYSKKLIDALNNEIELKDITINEIVERSKLDFDTVQSYLSYVRSPSYSNACVLYKVIICDKAFDDKKELNIFRDMCVSVFYSKFKVKFGSMTYKEAEEIYNVPRSTLHSYVKGTKKPLFETSYRISTAMGFSLMYDFDLLLKQKRRQNKIKELRLRSKLTQEEFATKLGIPVKTISNWEKGQRSCPNYIAKLIQYYLFNER